MSTLDKIPRHLLERAAADPRNGEAAVNALQAALASRGSTTPRTSAEASGRGSSAAEDTVTLVLPLPPKELSPNARVHWAKKARAVKEYRWWASNEAFCACLAAAIYVPQWERATVQATFYHRTRRRRDADNLAASLKPVWDGLQDARVVSNDAGLTHLPVVLLVDRERPRVEITVTLDRGTRPG